MNDIRPNQIKAARAILGWSQEDLAEYADIAATTVRNLELGFMPRRSTILVVRKAIENAGVEFTDGEGVRRRMESIKVFQGADNVSAFLEDVVETLKNTEDARIYAAFDDFRTMERAFGVQDRAGMKRIEKIAEKTPIQCLVAEEKTGNKTSAPFQTRLAPRQVIGPISYYVYGDKNAQVLCFGGGELKFVVFESPFLSLSYRSHFMSIWGDAKQGF